MPSTTPPPGSSTWRPGKTPPLHCVSTTFAAKTLPFRAVLRFPASKTYRELVSCSNCLDYQARRLETRIAGAKQTEANHVHMLNSTLTATSRTMCCILENYQTPDGVRVPEVLQPFLGASPGTQTQHTSPGVLHELVC